MKNLVNLVALIMVIGAIFSLNVYSQESKILDGENVTVINDDGETYESGRYDDTDEPTDKPPPDEVNHSQVVFGGQGIISYDSTITPTIDLSTFSASTNRQEGMANILITIPSNRNLSDRSYTKIIYKIRYIDEDGEGSDAHVRLRIIANRLDDNLVALKTIFNSDTDAQMGTNTVTVCNNLDSQIYQYLFNYADTGTRLMVTLKGTSALSARFYQLQVYKAYSC